jgi:muramoyltetrapeptide carboxypeptidase
MLKPRALHPGDRIAVVSPASPFAREEFDRGVHEIRRLGFEPVWDASVFERTGYVSGAASVRAAAFLQAWRDPTIAALIAARGGFGSVHLLPFLAATALRETPKPFIGYSDTTSLLTWLTIGCGITAIHGPMLERRLAHGEAGYHQASFLAALGSTPPGELMPERLTVMQSGDVAGPLYGGTLTQLVASLGTPYAFTPPDGCVLFIEDLNERPYRLDRMLTQLRLSGVLARARALVFGEMSGCDEPGGHHTAIDTVRLVLNGFTGPILFGFPSGHTAGPAWTLPFGVQTRIVADRRPRLIVEENALS